MKGVIMIDNNAGKPPANIEEKVNNLVVYIVDNLELGSLSKDEQAMVREDVFKEITNLLIEIGKVLLSFSDETNKAILNRALLEFKKIIGSMTNNWTVQDLELLVKLDEKKWQDFSDVMGRVARTLAREARERSYFADLMPQREKEEVIHDIEKEFVKVKHVLNTKINDLADNVNDYLDHTNKVVDMFEVKNHELREMLNSALYKLTEMRLTFHQMDVIGTKDSEEQMIRKDIEREAKKVANKHGIISADQIIRESKGY